ncbi:hypothetical protein CPB85DRAFT_1261647 [Mucidula mucida]|nr:hypothetical protein CPB85DRAFT_1261647 [Mucidula mucida]
MSEIGAKVVEVLQQPPVKSLAENAMARTSAATTRVVSLERWSCKYKYEENEEERCERRREEERRAKGGDLEQHTWLRILQCGDALRFALQYPPFWTRIWVAADGMISHNMVRTELKRLDERKDKSKRNISKSTRRQIEPDRRETRFLHGVGGMEEENNALRHFPAPARSQGPIRLAEAQTRKVGSRARPGLQVASELVLQYFHVDSGHESRQERCPSQVHPLDERRKYPEFNTEYAPGDSTNINARVPSINLKVKSVLKGDVPPAYKNSL